MTTVIAAGKGVQGGCKQQEDSRRVQGQVLGFQERGRNGDGEGNTSSQKQLLLPRLYHRNT